MSDFQERPSFEEFIQPGLERMMNPFDITETHSSWNPPTPEYDDPLGLFNTGASAGVAIDGPALLNPMLDVDVGAFTSEQGADAFGVDFDAGVFSGSVGSDTTTIGGLMRANPFGDGSSPINFLTTMPISAEGQAAGLNASLYDDGSTFDVGLGATGVGGSVTLGDDEDSLRMGLSAGPSFGFRVHHGDADNDGVSEAGFGFDFAEFSGDLKTEHLGEAWNNLMAGDFSPDFIWNEEDFLGPWDSPAQTPSR